jgi:hypothetical protein
MKGVTAFITCIMFGRTLPLRLRSAVLRFERICPFDGLAAMTYIP